MSRKPRKRITISPAAFMALEDLPRYVSKADLLGVAAGLPESVYAYAWVSRAPARRNSAPPGVNERVIGLCQIINGANKVYEKIHTGSESAQPTNGAKHNGLPHRTSVPPHKEVAVRPGMAGHKVGR